MSIVHTKIKKACYLFGFLFLISIPVVWISLCEVNFYGDLTRIGKLSESDFGWRQRQTEIEKSLLKQNSITESDILIIGDSFSGSLIWQTELLKDGEKTTTYHWDKVGAICANFDQIIKNSGFNGSRLIFQIVELGLEDRINKSLDCISHLNKLPEPVKIDSEILNQLDLQKKINLSGQFIAGLETKINSWFLNNTERYWEKLNSRSKSAYIFPIKDGCIMFSHHLCNLGLFYHQDYTKPPISNSIVGKIKLINHRLKNYQITWLIVPNKSTVYQREDVTEFWQSLEESELGPNLLKEFISKKSNIIDLYKPNDTHLSNNGYITLGQVTSNFIKQRSK